MTVGLLSISPRRRSVERCRSASACLRASMSARISISVRTEAARSWRISISAGFQARGLESATDSAPMTKPPWSVSGTPA